MVNIHSKWQWKPLALYLFLVAALLCSFSCSLWQMVDLWFFRVINHPLKDRHFLQVFWALANHRAADWLEDFVFLGFYLFAIVKTKKGNRQKMGAQLLFCVLLSALTILLINRVLCRDVLRLRRDSPSIVLDHAIILSNSLSWIAVKTGSSKSFPGDHATLGLMLSLSFAYIVRGKLALAALLYGALLCLPRMVIGSHWLSDIVVGSGCIALSVLSLAFFSPLASKMTTQIERFINVLFKKKMRTAP